MANEKDDMRRDCSASLMQDGGHPQFAEYWHELKETWESEVPMRLAV
jgi:hypothetical protein